ncbi:DUF6777 domain-containing protein, partial [Streptomyces sp. UNOC14_S4]|uniref:DUF6777 domain-containing protein n=1 Tax=Streptomyces sp. UNOC14_S4 TaxID=2872340 RepID=UPI001E527BE2
MPKLALLAGAVVAAAALAVFFLRSDNGGSGDVYLQAANADGMDPFTQSTAKEPAPQATASPSAPAGTGSSGKRSVQGSAPGLYGGTQGAASCDVDRQITYLTEDQTKARAFAFAAGIEAGNIPDWLRGLTSLQLRSDTRVTDHGFRNGSATSFQAVLQAGTAVLVDNRGMPRVRCACGNPLGPPSSASGTPKGKTWHAYRSENVITVVPADAAMDAFVVYDPQTGHWFQRPVGTQGDRDTATSRPSGGASSAPPQHQSASPGGASPATPPSPSQPYTPTPAPPSMPGYT